VGPFLPSSLRMPDDHSPAGSTLSTTHAERHDAPETARPRTGRDSRVRRARRRRAITLLAVDATMLALAIGASLFGAHHTDSVVDPPRWVGIYVVMTFLALAVRRGYRYRIEASPLDHLGVAVVATALAAMVTITLRQILDPEPAVADETVRLWAFATVYLWAGRLALNLATHQPSRRGLPTLIVGAGVVGQMLARRLEERPSMGLRPVGFLDLEPLPMPAGRHDGHPSLPVLGASWDLAAVVHEHDVEHVIITFSTAPHEVLVNMVRACRSLGVDVSVVPRLFEEVHSEIEIEHIGGVALLRVGQIDPRGWQFDIKYALDRIFAALVIFLTAPTWIVIAILVKLSSPGPLLFRQVRVGLDGREFGIFKFRTMREPRQGEGQVNAAWVAAETGADEADMPEIVDRRTPIGRFLRRYSLDELPQILNVLRGEMSFIGPRPEQAPFVEAFEGHVYRYGDRHRVRSGITGWAQVQGLRGETSVHDRIEWDNFYVENWSPWLDLKILALTLPAVFSGRNAA
jgi:exopolysaccharide biosynthesis polyprenyl glycosylphosphotransferase